MSILSESLTIGLLLALVFGALFFYLYSRVAYSEKRVGLIENILIDIKMNQEQQPVHVLPSIPPSMNFNNVSFIPPSQHSIELQEMPNTPTCMHIHYTQNCIELRNLIHHKGANIYIYIYIN